MRPSLSLLDGGDRLLMDGRMYLSGVWLMPPGALRGCGVLGWLKFRFDRHAPYLFFVADALRFCPKKRR
jgi:hypothetical protein